MMSIKNLDKKKTFLLLTLSASAGFWLLMTYSNMMISVFFIQHFPKFITTLVHAYQTDYPLFSSTFYLLHVYFGLLLYVGMPVIVFSSFVLSVIYLKQKKWGEVLLLSILPFLFSITTYALAEGWLLFT